MSGGADAVTRVCVKCGSEKPVKGRALLPDGWVWSDPDENGCVEPVCNKCQEEQPNENE